MAFHSIELCAGVGMLGEGVRAAFEFHGIDHRTICYVEREAAAAAQLVALMEAGALHAAPIWSDMLTFDGGAWHGLVDGIVAGFPCQDLSIAGRRAGLDGKRSGLFFRVLDIADDSGAWFLVLENVAGIASATATVVDEAEGDLEERAAARVLGELADRGWNAEWITLSASDVGASHGRARWFCLAWRMADARHGPRADQSLSIGWGSGSSDHCAIGEALDDARCVQRCARYEQDRPAGTEASRNETHDRPADGSGNVGITECSRRPPTRSRSPFHPGREPEQGCSDLAHASQPRPPHAEQPGQPGQPPAFGRGAVAELRGAPLFAPGPADPAWHGLVHASRVGRWERVVADDKAGACPWAPATQPGVRMLADGMAIVVDESRAHQLRQVGNGVVPLQAAAALIELLRRAREH